MRFVIAATVLMLAAGLALAEDKLILKDGQVVTGRIVSLNATDVKIESGDETMRVPRWAIEKIERENDTGETVTLPMEDKMRRTQRSNALSGTPLAQRDYPKATPRLLAWVDTCVEHLGSQDEGVRTSATAALRFIGPAARPALEIAVAGDDATRASSAERVLTHVDRVEARVAEWKAREEAERAARSPANIMRKWIGVSDEQFPAFLAAVDEYHERQSELAAQVRAGDFEPADASRRAAELRAQFDAKLAGILDPEQMKRYRKTAPSTTPPSAAP